MCYIKNIKILHLARSLESIFQTVLAIEFTLPVNAGISCVFRFKENEFFFHWHTDSNAYIHPTYHPTGYMPSSCLCLTVQHSRKCILQNLHVIAYTPPMNTKV